MKQVRVKAKGQNRRVEAAPVMMQAAELQPVKVEGVIRGQIKENNSNPAWGDKVS